MKAIIQFQNKQYLIKPDEELIVDRIEDKPGSKIKISNVLMTIDGQVTKVGTPHVTGASVTAEVLAHQKGKKIRVATYKAKSRYRRVKGFRAYQTKLKIKSIDL